MKDEDEQFMSMCIRLARKGSGYVSPNPMVGCVIVKNGNIIGRGFHEIFGGPHAEVNAVKDAAKRGNRVKGSTVYVNLEPCSHQGKTPPCASLLAELRPSRVVIGVKDPYHKVNGKGIKILRRAGITTDCGILESECAQLNKFFFTYAVKRRPYVTLKTAQSIDGRIALPGYESRYITSPAARTMVHKLRKSYDAVLIGANTARYDDPSLDAGLAGGRMPLRVVIDTDLTLPGNLKIFTDNSKQRTVVIHNRSVKLRKRADVNYVGLPALRGRIRIEDILKSLAEMNVISLLVEGGSYVFSEFIKSGLYDELAVFTAPKIIGKGISAFDEIHLERLKDSYILELVSVKEITGGELLINYRNVYGNS